MNYLGRERQSATPFDNKTMIQVRNEYICSVHFGKLNVIKYGRYWSRGCENPSIFSCESHLAYLPAL